MLLSLNAAESNKYPTPRFPSYVKPPKSIDDIMPYARAAVRQTGGRTPLGLVEKGALIGLVTEAVADDTVMQAIVRAYKERGVEARIIPEYELAGVNREEVLQGHQSEQVVHVRARLHGNQTVDHPALRRSGGAEEMAQRAPPGHLQGDVRARR